MTEIIDSTYISELKSVFEKNLAISNILPVQKTNEHFKSAEDAAQAFKNKAVSVIDNITKDKKYLSIIEKHKISEDYLQEIIGTWIYSRLKNPVNILIEKNISAMENAKSTAVFASGLAAMSAVIKQYTNPAKKIEETEDEESGEYMVTPGDKIVVIVPVYGGSNALLKNIQEETGRVVEFITLEEFENNGLPKNTKSVVFESCSNPTLRVMPIKKIVNSAKKIGAITICDNTFTPMIIKPIDHGVDFVAHSMTKSINGKSEDLGGSISGKKEEINKLLDLHTGQRMTGGAIMAPRVGIDFLDKIKDLPERAENNTSNAKKIIEVAKKFKIETSFIEDDPNFAEVRNKDIPEGRISNGMVGFYFDSREVAHEFVNRMIKRVGYCAVSLGSVDTYYSIPADTTSSELTEEEMKKEGVTPGYVRVSCGTEENLSLEIESILQQMEI